MNMSAATANIVFESLRSTNVGLGFSKKSDTGFFEITKAGQVTGPDFEILPGSE